jgi:Protein of unknown function (DUF1439)
MMVCMTYRIIFLLLAACAVVSSLVGCGYTNGKLTLDFSASQIQNAIAPKFPQENCPTPLTCIKLLNPKVSLAENSDRITMAFDTAITWLQQPVTGTAVITAKPRYQPATGEIFLDDTKIADLQLRGVSANVTQVATQYGSVLAQLALQRTPIYSFKNGQAEKLAKMGIADVRVVDGKLRVTLDPALAQAPKVVTP